MSITVPITVPVFWLGEYEWFEFEIENEIKNDEYQDVEGKWEYDVFFPVPASCHWQSRGETLLFARLFRT